MPEREPSRSTTPVDGSADGSPDREAATTSTSQHEPPAPDTAAVTVAGGEATSQPSVPTDDAHWLTRLNRRGFRLVMVADVVGLWVVMLGTMFVRFGTDWPTYPVPTYLMSFAVATVIFLGSLYFGGLYEREARLGAPSLLPRAARQTLAAGGLVALINLGATGAARELGITTSRALPFPITNLVVLIVLGAAVVALNRRLVLRLRTRREGPPKVVLAGDRQDVEVAREHLGMDRDRARVVAEHTDPDRLLDVVAERGATDVVVVSGAWIDDLYPLHVERLERSGITVLLRVTARETLYGLERVREIGGLPFVVLRTQTMPRSRSRFKRFFDVVVLAGISPVAVPLVLAVTLYQLVVAGRPLLYRQERVGARGRTFQMVKFRTMAVDAEADGRGARLADVDDPRVIRGCGWIRATRMDELPQLWNVLKGEMSLVGPRPERPELTAGFTERIPGYARRHELPPGLTGLAQIHGRYHTDPEYKLGYDLQYLVNWSPVLDVEIMLRTIWVVLTGRL
ncbi:MAG: exopolysaccharide biosynthesis polyprenyl glycosylphosphotransferase [Nitriliruptoraceae bacterium]